MKLTILYHDKQLVAINKPSGLLVHRSAIDKQETLFALQLLRNQLGQRVYPLHRLDKPTSGVLLFALNKHVARSLSAIWQNVEKNYLAITRGRVMDTIIDTEITYRSGKDNRLTEVKKQAAKTTITCLATLSLPVVFGRSCEQYTKTTFSLVKATPTTGRKHQIRKHLKHIHHPIVGDTCYGRGEINRYFRENYHCHRLLLHCQSLAFVHPVKQQVVTITAPLDNVFKQLTQLFTTSV